MSPPRSPFRKAGIPDPSGESLRTDELGKNLELGLHPHRQGAPSTPCSSQILSGSSDKPLWSGEPCTRNRPSSVTLSEAKGLEGGRRICRPHPTRFFCRLRRPQNDIWCKAGRGSQEGVSPYCGGLGETPRFKFQGGRVGIRSLTFGPPTKPSCPGPDRTTQDNIAYNQPAFTTIPRRSRYETDTYHHRLGSAGGVGRGSGVGRGQRTGRPQHAHACGHGLHLPGPPDRRRQPGQRRLRPAVRAVRRRHGRLPGGRHHREGGRHSKRRPLRSAAGLWRWRLHRRGPLAGHRCPGRREHRRLHPPSAPARS